jgi:prevent-host-death family protein
MDKNTTLTLTTARKQIFVIAQAVQTPGRVFTLTENGVPKAVVMSAEEFEGWTETLDILQLYPHLAAEARHADQAVKSGAYKKLPSLQNYKGELSLLSTSMTKNVRSKTRKKSSKRA